MRSRSIRYWFTRASVLPLFAVACTEDHAIVTPASAKQPASKFEVSAQGLTPDTVVAGAGVKLSVYETGNASGPPIVFIHGFTGSYLSWQRQFARPLIEDFRLISYDMRGHAGSQKPLDATSYTTSALWADDLEAVIKAKNLTRPVLVGWSYGGFVIADYLRKFTDANVGGVVFIGATAKLGTPEAASFLTDEVLALFPEILSTDVARSINGTRELTRMFADPLKGDAWEISYGSAMMLPPEVRGAMFTRTFDNDDVLSRLSVPALVVQGTRDRIVKVSAARHIARTVPQAQLHLYDNVGHAPHLEVPNRLNRDLAEFVRSARRP